MMAPLPPRQKCQSIAPFSILSVLPVDDRTESCSRSESERDDSSRLTVSFGLCARSSDSLVQDGLDRETSLYPSRPQPALTKIWPVHLFELFSMRLAQSLTQHANLSGNDILVPSAADSSLDSPCKASGNYDEAFFLSRKLLMNY